MTVPLSNSAPGRPYPGTRGVEGRPAYFTITANNPADYYNVTATRAPRPGYNTGGTSAADAPVILAGVPQLGSLWQQEPGQYYWIHLEPGQTMYVRGQVRARDSSSLAYTAGFRVRLYGSDNSLLATLLPQLLFKGTTSFPATGTNPQTYTNATGSPRDVYLKLDATNGFVQDFQLTAEVPTLKLFLDSNNDFSLNAPAATNDANTYVPWAITGSGLSESIAAVCGEGQLVQLIAAFVDSSGQIVTPPPGVAQVEFQLEQTSAFTGCAMNSGTSIEADFSLVGGPAATFTGNVATIGLRARDYGGFTVARAVTSALHTTAPTRIPKDDGVAGGTANNWLPDAGWRDYEGVLIPDLNLSSADSDPTPAGLVPGDGLHAFEEYRGFVVSGLHQRTNPQRKDLFYRTDLPTAAGDLSQLCDQDGCVRVHRVLGTEFNYYVQQVTPPPNWQRRIINFNYQNNGAGGQLFDRYDQAVVEIIEGGFLSQINPITGQPEVVLGSTPTYQSIPQPPMLVIEPIRVFSESIRWVSPPTLNSTTVIDNPTDYDKARQTVGHELGHATGINHWTVAQNPGRPASVMVTQDYFSQPNGQPNPNAWSNIPHTYDATDQSQFRLR